MAVDRILEVSPCNRASNGYNAAMAAKRRLSDQLRNAIERCGKSRYAISKETGVAESVLSRFVNQQTDLSLDNLERVCECIGARLVVDPQPRRRRTTKKGT